MTELRRRFDHRLTLVTGPGGAGKTTSIALAMEDNRLDPFGVDLWVPAVEHDRDPDHFVAGLAQAVGISTVGSIDACTDALCDAVWAQAPRDVVLIVDDVHLVTSPGSLGVLDALLRELPANGHLLLAGRTQPEIAMARLLALGHVLTVTAEDLSFDDDELAELIRSRLPPEESDRMQPDDLSRLPALADLRLRAGPGAGHAFLWEEVLASLPVARRAALTRCSVLEVIDDALVGLLSDGAMTAEEIVEGLPLVDVTDGSSFRLHALLRAALQERADPADLRTAAQGAADVELERGRLRAAAELAVHAQDQDRLLTAARRFALLPGMRRTFEDLLVVRNLVEAAQPGSALAQLLRAECLSGELSTTTEVTRIGAALVAVAECARTIGDAEMEAAALYRATVWISLDSTVPDTMVDRLSELATTVPVAAQVVNYVLAERAMFAGDPEASLALLASGTVADAELDLVDRLGLLCSLGRPEEVGVGMTTADLAGMPDGAELYVGFALWTRGQLTPEVALPIALSMTAQALVRRVVHPIVAILGVTSFMALAAGDSDTAVRHVRAARDEARFGCSAHIRAFISMAAAATAVETEDETVATAILGEMLDELPMGKWPIRAYLLGLPMIYVLRHETRATLDECRFGPALTVARDAGRALVEFRRTGSAEAAAALPWDRPACLRAHVLPAHLCELALAAQRAGSHDAGELLHLIPNVRSRLAMIAARSDAAAAELAKRELRRLPAHPTQRISVAALGPLRVFRDGQPIDHPDWQRRARVRELMGMLVEERRVSRTRIVATLWPDLGDDAALRNLRVTLTYLLRVLEPDRPARAASTIVCVDGDDLVLDLGVEVDVDGFEHEMRRALDHDRAGAPGSALEVFRIAIAYYGGEYLTGMNGGWLESTRGRLHLLALGGIERAGELELAAGEPERAGEMAALADTLSPGNERAARLRAMCLAHVGDRRGAAEVLRRVCDELTGARMEPAPETRRLMERLGAALSHPG